jgi:putative restriction endonuclease
MPCRLRGDGGIPGGRVGWRCTIAVVRAYVGVTDDNWYRFLAGRPGVTEVNFWQPSGAREFRVLSPGEPFFFKTHYPHNRLVGGGFFSGSVRLPVSEAWEFFGEANGVASIQEMRARIGRYRRAPIGPGEDPVIGCLFVRDVRFFPAGAVAEAPPLFARNIVQGKSYDMADPAVAGYFADVLQLTLGAAVELDFSQPWHRSGPVFGDPRLAPYRLGQQSFKAVVLDSYHRRCAISGTHIPPVLQAAHIRPVAEGGEHRLDNGLLLRSDIHTLFDRGYLGVDPQHRLLVSPRLRADFSNGDQFYAQAGQVIDLPTRRADRPGREFLEWHLDEVFLKAAAT